MTRDAPAGITQRAWRHRRAAGTARMRRTSATKSRARLRDQARLWLRAELAAWGKKLDSDPAAKSSVENALKQWRTDPDLAGSARARSAG